MSKMFNNKKAKKYKLENIPSEKVVFIPFDSDYIKFEAPAKEANPLGERYQELVGIRVWIDKNTPCTLKPQKSQKSRKLSFVFPVFKKEGKLLDIYEIHPTGYDLLFNYFQQFNDKIDNPQWHTSLEKIKEEKKYSYTIARVRDHEKPKEQGQLGFLSPNESILLEIIDFSDIQFENLKKISKEKEHKINKLLDELYLEKEDIRKIKEWMHIDDFIKGKGKFNKKNGLILYGPAGTGKTITASKVFREIFEEHLEFNFIEEKMSELIGGEGSGLVGGFASGMRKIFLETFKTITHTRKPCLIFMDEATDIVRDVSGSTSSGDKWISEGIEIFKNYLNPQRYPGVVFCLCTNLPKPKNFDQTIFDQRLGGINYPLPNYDRCYSFWKNNLIPILENNLVNIFNQNQESKIKEMSELCANTITVRTMFNFCEDYYKSYPEYINDFKFFKEEFIKIGKNNIEIERNKNLESAKTQKEADEIYEIYEQQKKKLNRIQKGLSVEEEKEQRAKKELEYLDGKLQKDYEIIHRELLKLYELYTKNTQIVNQKSFKDKLNEILQLINEINKYINVDSNINKDILDSLHNILNNLSTISQRIINNSEKDGDFFHFFSIIRELPQSKDIFNDNKIQKQNSGLITDAKSLSDISKHLKK